MQLRLSTKLQSYDLVASKKGPLVALFDAESVANVDSKVVLASMMVVGIKMCLRWLVRIAEPSAFPFNSVWLQLEVGLSLTFYTRVHKSDTWQGDTLGNNIYSKPQKWIRNHARQP